MGQAKRRLERMRREQPWCIYCGGEAIGTSVDHMPPITMFDRRQRPKGLEFLACDDCHAGTRPLDQIAGALCRFYVQGNFGVALEEFQEAMAGVRNNFPDIIEEWQPLGEGDHPIVTEAKARLPLTKFALTSGPKTAALLSRFAARAAFALHVEACGRVVPKSGGAVVRWFTNAEFALHDEPSEITAILGTSQTLAQGTKSVRDQFEYASRLLTDRPASLHKAKFRTSFSLHALVDEDANELSKSLGPSGFEIVHPGFLKL